MLEPFLASFLEPDCIDRVEFTTGLSIGLGGYIEAREGYEPREVVVGLTVVIPPPPLPSPPPLPPTFDTCKYTPIRVYNMVMSGYLRLFNVRFGQARLSHVRAGH